MTDKITMTDTSSGFNVAAINDNFALIADALNNDVLWRDNPSGTDNQMISTNLDMNGNRILNLAAPIDPTDPVRLEDLTSTPASGIVFDPVSPFTATTVQDAIVQAYTMAIAADDKKTQVVVNVVDLGADPTGVADSTAAFVAAIATGLPVIASAGTFLTQQITWPTNSSFWGVGPKTIIKPVAGYTQSSLWTTASGASNIRMGLFNMDVDTTSFASCIPIFFNPGDNNYVHDVNIVNGGYLGIWGSTMTNTTLERVTVGVAQAVGLMFSGGARNTFKNCRVLSTLQSHGICFQGGDQQSIIDCLSVSAQGFGVTLQGTVNSIASRNRIHNSRVEALTMGGDGGDGNLACDNIATWDTGVSEDFGMSCGANGSVGTFRNKFHRNYIRGCGKSGIALAADSTAGWSVIQCEVTENTIIDSNQLGLGTDNGGGGGVILYGATCSGSIVRGNRIIDTGGGKLVYGVYEAQIGTGGYPQNNNIFDNQIDGQSDVKVSKRGNSSEAFNQTSTIGYLSYSPTIGAASGTITSATATNALYYEMNGRVDYFFNISIINNGTGTGALTITLPFNHAWGVLNGRENSLTGYQLVGEVSGNIATIRTYNNSYPAGTGATLTLFGTAWRTF